MDNSYEQQAIDLVAQNEALKAQVIQLKEVTRLLISNSVYGAPEIEVQERAVLILNSTSKQCLNSVKGVAIIEAFEKVGAGFPKGMGDHVRNLIGSHKD